MQAQIPLLSRLHKGRDLPSCPGIRGDCPEESFPPVGVLYESLSFSDHKSPESERVSLQLPLCSGHLTQFLFLLFPISEPAVFRCLTPNALVPHVSFDPHSDMLDHPGIPAMFPDQSAWGIPRPQQCFHHAYHSRP